MDTRATTTVQQVASLTAEGRLTGMSQGGRAVSCTYYTSGDENGYVHTITDALSRTVSFAYTDGRVTTTLPDTRTIGYSYDDNGNLTSVTPPSRPAHGFAFDDIDLVSDYTQGRRIKIHATC